MRGQNAENVEIAQRAQKNTKNGFGLAWLAMGFLPLRLTAPLRHSRADGNPCLGLKAALDSRMRGNDGQWRFHAKLE